MARGPDTSPPGAALVAAAAASAAGAGAVLGVHFVLDPDGPAGGIPCERHGGRYHRGIDSVAW
jgi:hypothetical protein